MSQEQNRNQEKNNQPNREQDINQLLKVRREKLAALQADGKDPFQITKYNVTHHSQEIKDSFDELEGKQVSIAGRVMSKRVMGKASFCNVQDLQGDIQCYVARDSIGEEPYADFKKYDVGDIVGVEGEVFTTENLRVIRPGYGVKPKYLEELLGKRSGRAIRRGEPIGCESLNEGDS